MLTNYFAWRRFQSPFLTSSETVSPLSALWASLCGPVYYWRKRALIEALLFASALGLLLLFDEDSDIVGLSDGIDVATMIWLGLALAAPILLPACYRRKGWVEIAGKGTRA
jgi:hypothetical protein